MTAPTDAPTYHPRPGYVLVEEDPKPSGNIPENIWANPADQARSGTVRGYGDDPIMDELMDYPPLHAGDRVLFTGVSVLTVPDAPSFLLMPVSEVVAAAYVEETTGLYELGESDA